MCVCVCVCVCVLGQGRYGEGGEGRGSLGRVLRCYALWQPQVGYCQVRDSDSDSESDSDNDSDRDSDSEYHGDRQRDLEGPECAQSRLDRARVRACLAVRACARARAWVSAWGACAAQAVTARSRLESVPARVSHGPCNGPNQSRLESHMAESVTARVSHGPRESRRSHARLSQPRLEPVTVESVTARVRHGPSNARPARAGDEFCGGDLAADDGRGGVCAYLLDICFLLLLEFRIFHHAWRPCC